MKDQSHDLVIMINLVKKSHPHPQNRLARILSTNIQACFGLFLDSPQPSISFEAKTSGFPNQYFVHQKFVELNIAISIIVKVLEDGLHVGHVHHVIIVLVLRYLEDEPGHEMGKYFGRIDCDWIVTTCTIP